MVGRKMSTSRRFASRAVESVPAVPKGPVGETPEGTVAEEGQAHAGWQVSSRLVILWLVLDSFESHVVVPLPFMDGV